MPIAVTITRSSPEGNATLVITRCITYVACIRTVRGGLYNEASRVPRIAEMRICVNIGEMNSCSIPGLQPQRIEGRRQTCYCMSDAFLMRRVYLHQLRPAKSISSTRRWISSAPTTD